ncbi:hypothetical protein FG386_002508 [Cryptosporidium ryanae]|uniref:uncharacterized protein n=1 Tax=Cryptosporidium ryanae TaxID=515981 RepID=UPI003519E58A|nr:hypothetical protein FG386_002508 [Cryptosporidium ryanae]
MKSFLLVCSDDSPNNDNVTGLKRGDRWFFGENEIINASDRILNIPLDNYNYKKFSFDSIITNKISDLTDVSAEITRTFFSEMGNKLIISTPYSFGTSCPYLLEGTFNNNKLVGPGILLLTLKNIFSYSQEFDEGRKYDIFCTWNGITNNGGFVDFFENVDIYTSEMIQMSPISNEFGYCKGLLVSSVNTLASIINEIRNSYIWKDTCHYIFTIRLSNKHNHYGNTLNADINLSSITLVSLGEGVKTKLSGQVSPWDVLDLLIRDFDNLESGKNVYNLATYLNDFLVYPKLITLIYRFPHYIDPYIPRHAKEIKHILGLMLFHEKFIEFFKSENRYLTKSLDSGGDHEFVKKDNIRTFRNEFKVKNNYNNSNNLINFLEGPDSLFSREESDAPTPPPNPIKKGNIDENNVSPVFFENYIRYSKIDEPFFNSNDIEYDTYKVESTEKGNVGSEQVDDLVNEISALKQEMSVLETALVNKNEIIVRLEKLLEGRDSIIKHNQETIKTLKEQVNESSKDAESTKQSKIVRQVPNNLMKERKIVTQIGKFKPSVVDCSIQNEIKQCDDSFFKELDGVIVESDNQELKKENTECVHKSKAAILSGVAKMAFEKFVNN